MAKKRVQLYSTENVIEDMYLHLSRYDTKGIVRVHIPKSDVFYIRRAIYEDTGNWWTLDHVERSLYVEGHLRRNEVLDPDRKRQFIDGAEWF